MYAVQDSSYFNGIVIYIPNLKHKKYKYQYNKVIWRKLLYKNEAHFNII